MVANLQPIFVHIPNISVATFVNADGTTPKDIFTPVTDGSKLFALNVTSTDSVARNMQVFLRISSVNYLLGTVPIPALAGSNALIPSVNLLDPDWIPCLDPDGSLFLLNTHTIRVGPTVAVTAALTITVAAIGGDY